MNLNQLVYFGALARTGSYTQAADECDVSEPVIYRCVKSLEKACGIKLLERRGKQIIVTKAGRAIYEYAVQIASLRTRAEQALAEETAVTPSHISIGCGRHAGSCLLPDILAEWTPRHPHVTISVAYGHGQQLQEYLLDGRLDFALTAETNWLPKLRKQLMFADNLVVVSAPGHRLAKSSLVPLMELSHESWIVSFRGTALREEIDRVEREYGVHFRLAIEAGGQDMVKRLCRAGLGIAVVAKSMVLDEVASNQLCMLDVESFPRNLRYYLLHRPGKTLTPEMRSFLAAADSWVRQRRLSEGPDAQPRGE